MKLLGSVPSPYTRKVRIVLAEKKIDCDFETVDVNPAENPVNAHNPLGKVPALVLDNDEVLFDSPVIVEYLDSLQAPALLAASGVARWDMLRWEALADGVLDAVVTRLLESRRPEAQQSADNLRRQEEKIARSLDYMARRLGNGPWFVADRFTLADLVVAVALEYTDFRYPYDWRGRHPRLGQWLAGVSARPSFIETRPPGMK